MSSIPIVGHSVASNLGYYSLTPSKTEPIAVCPAPKPGEAQCMSIVDPTAATRAQAEAEASLGLGPEPPASPSLEGIGEEGGFTPAEIRKAYGIPETGGSEQTVAIVDAYNDPDAESDLQKYREKYKVYYRGTEFACTEANKCFKKVDQAGETEKEAKEKSKAFPGNEPEWSQEISLDLDMVSAVCPECKILLVEATNNKENAEKVENLYLAEDEAVTLKATEVSNSWLGGEGSGETSDDTYFDHAGIPITAAAGDNGYGVGYPAASPDVISVGGTTLKKTKEGSRGWEESVWRGSGSGCSLYEKSKPEWQHDPGCAKRTDNDVAAVANPNSPVSVYDSYEYEGRVGWLDFGGTSVATPIVAAVEAHASKAVREEKGAEAFYRHALFNVTGGSNGYCRGYLCHGEEGYNGPTGWGTPDGPLELSAGFHADTARSTNESMTGATLHGYVNPEGVKTEYQFEYGKTTSYGSKTALSSAESGVIWKGVSQSITGLQNATTYHYRLVATRGVETIHGADHTFKTTAWTIQTPAEPSGEHREYRLEGVSCPSSAACTAVGKYYNPAKEYDLMLAEHWNGTEWQVQSTPQPSEAEGSSLQAVSCSSSTACTAVGSYSKKEGGFHAFAERWNGTEWQLQSTPNPSGAEDSQLFGVSCSSATACTAVGRYHNTTLLRTQMLAESWNGTEWKVQSTLEPSGGEESQLTGVSCSSSTACTAAGLYYDPTITKKAYQPLAERWNGTEWKAQTMPNPTGAEGSELYAVSCGSATACMAVGEYYNSGAEEKKMLAESWNGTEWKVQSTPEPSGATEESRLTGVSCSSAAACTAVGQGADEALFADHWNGTEWAIQPTPVAEESDRNLRWEGVSCTSPQICVTVGYGYNDSFVLSALVDRELLPPPSVTTKAATGVGETTATLNGTVNPNGSETKYSFEYGTSVSYGSKTAEASAGSGESNVEESKTVTGLMPGTIYHFRITATNTVGTTHGEDQTLTTLTPSWRITSTPNPSETLNIYQYGVSCTASNACTSVGQWSPNGNVTYKPLAERWNGTAWALQAIPVPTGTEQTTFQGVSCASSTMCIAVGYYVSSSGVYFSLTEIWNGTEWKIQSTAEPTGTLNSLLHGVSCTSSTACTAVGWYEDSSGVELPWAERWNGTAWSVQSTPTPTGATASYPFRVSCSSATACTMVGYYTNSSGAYEPFAEGWNGTEWKSQSVPTPTGGTRTLPLGVSCTSSSACTMVGSYKNSSGNEVTLAEYWNGTEWSVQSTPNPTGATVSELLGVSCTSTTACTAAGVSLNSSSKRITLAEHWNGTEWQIQSTPNDVEGEGSLTGGVSCSSLVSCAAVGEIDQKTLAEIYS